MEWEGGRGKSGPSVRIGVGVEMVGYGVFGRGGEGRGGEGAWKDSVFL